MTIAASPFIRPGRGVLTNLGETLMRPAAKLLVIGGALRKVIAFRVCLPLTNPLENLLFVDQTRFNTRAATGTP